MFIAQALIPLIKSSYQGHKFRSTYRSYLLAHVKNTLEHFQGVGSAESARTHAVVLPDSGWLRFLNEHNLEVPEIFVRVSAVINEALDDDNYIPSVSYLGLEESSLDHTSPIWRLNGPVSAAALEYFLTQNQIRTALDYQYNGWYFERIKSSKEDRERWCRGLENVLIDMAQHYKAAYQLRHELQKFI